MNKPIDISNVVLETERLKLRPWKESDLEDLFEYASVDGVGEMAGWLPHKNREESKQILEDFIKGKKTFAIEYNQKVIGSVGIEKYKEESFPEYDRLLGREIGYVLSKAYWGKGLMPEAVKRVIQYLFEEEQLDFITCGHYLRNNQSARVQEKCGFKFIKKGQYTTSYGTVEESRFTIILKADYQ